MEVRDGGGDDNIDDDDGTAQLIVSWREVKAAQVVEMI
jgi:hypothetical protein